MFPCHRAHIPFQCYQMFQLQKILLPAVTQSLTCSNTRVTYTKQYLNHALVIRFHCTTLCLAKRCHYIFKVVRDMRVVPGNYGHDRFFYLPTKDLAPFSIHIPTKKPSFTLINDFVVDSHRREFRR